MNNGKICSGAQELAKKGGNAILLLQQLREITHYDGSWVI